MPPDLEPAGALAERSAETDEREAALLALEHDIREAFDPLEEGECNHILEGLNQAFNLGCAAVREPLERRVAELEAQLASARGEALREAAGVARSALRGAARAYDAMIAEVQSGDDHELKVRFHRYAKDSVGAALAEVELLIEQLSEPPAAQKEHHG